MNLIRIALIGAVMAAGVSIGMPAVQAVPGDPMAGCETQVFANYCDGPIREDGSWRRCLMARGSFSGGFDDVPGVYVPPVQNCYIIPSADQIPPTPLGQPDHHIDG